MHSLPPSPRTLFFPLTYHTYLRVHLDGELRRVRIHEEPLGERVVARFLVVAGQGFEVRSRGVSVQGLRHLRSLGPLPAGQTRAYRLTVGSRFDVMVDCHVHLGVIGRRVGGEFGEEERERWRGKGKG